jgi:hypothetical protein
LSSIIKPPRQRRWPDTHIAPIKGKRGSCALCTHYSDLTENHIPPEAVGNDGFWIGRSYLTAATEGKEMFQGRAFRGGLRFRTLCRDCNSGLGGREDKAIIDFFDRVRKLVESPIITSPIIRVPAKPNLIYRGLLAHLISANDSGVPCSFDSEAREIFFGRRDIRLSSWNLFYWIFTGSSIFLMRNAYHTQWHPSVEVTPIQILKSYPLGYVCSEAVVHGIAKYDAVSTEPRR